LKQATEQLSVSSEEHPESAQHDTNYGALSAGQRYAAPGFSHA
jgi:hypothetical protein